MRDAIMTVWLMVCLILPTTAAASFYVIPAVGGRTANIVLVSPKADAAASGQALRDALAKIDDASDTNPYLIFLEPGVYDIGSTPIVMKDYVAIMGSGRDLTTIEGRCYSGLNSIQPVIHGNLLDHFQLGGLTIKNITQNNSSARTIHIQACTNAILDNLHVLAESQSMHDNYALSIDGGDITMNDVISECSTQSCYNSRSLYTQGLADLYIKDSFFVNSNAIPQGTGSIYSGYAMYINSSDLTMMNVRTEALGSTNNYGIYVSRANLDIKHSTISGDDYAINVGGTSTHYIDIALSQLIGALDPGEIYRCYGTYDETNTFVGCPAP